MSEPELSLFQKPRPAPGPTSEPFWAGLREHRLVLQQCASCGKVRHYPRPMCDACYSMEATWAPASGRGTVHSYTICHHAFHPGFKRELPYAVLTVELEEGVRMVGPAVGIDAAALEVGLPVEIAYQDVDDELTLPAFGPRTSG
jgi:uncharacterized OB-fold protein